MGFFFVFELLLLFFGNLYQVPWKVRRIQTGENLHTINAVCRSQQIQKLPKQFDVHLKVNSRWF